MAGPDTIPDLAYQKPDGSLFARLEMEEQMRKVWPKIHWIRIKANKIYGLPRQAAFDMREAVLRHWTLDEMARRGQINGDISGVDAQTYNDDASTRQFIQRLQYLIQSGQAITPQEGEGVDMNTFVPPPPPMGAAPSNGQQQPQQYQQPPAPPGYPQQQQMPQGMPPSPPQQMQPPPMPQQPPQQYAAPPGPPPQQYAPPIPGAGMPQMPQTAVPPMPGAPPPQMPQPQAAPQGGRRKRGGGDQQQPAAPVPPMPQAQGFPPQQFAPPGAPPNMMPPPGVPNQGFAAPPQQFAPQAQQPQQAPMQAAPDPRIDQILANQARLAAEIVVVQAGLTVFLRSTYQKQGGPDLRAFLAEIGINFPQ